MSYQSQNNKSVYQIVTGVYNPLPSQALPVTRGRAAEAEPGALLGVLTVC